MKKIKPYQILNFRKLLTLLMFLVLLAFAFYSEKSNSSVSACYAKYPAASGYPCIAFKPTSNGAGYCIRATAAYHCPLDDPSKYYQYPNFGSLGACPSPRIWTVSDGQESCDCPDGEEYDSATNTCNPPQPICQEGESYSTYQGNSACCPSGTIPTGNIFSPYGSQGGCGCPDVPQGMQTGVCASDTPDLSDQCENDLQTCINTCGGTSSIASFECTNDNNTSVNSDCQCGTPPDNGTGCAPGETYGSVNDSWGCYPNGSGGNDTDNDGIPDSEDNDIDGDGIPNNSDDDIDGDGIGNSGDDDVDGDGINNNSDDTPAGTGSGVTNNITNNTYNTTNNTYNETADIDFSSVTGAIAETNSKIDSLSASVTAGSDSTNQQLSAQNLKLDALVTETQFSAAQLAAVNQGLNTTNAQLQALNDGNGSLLTSMSTLNDTVGAGNDALTGIDGTLQTGFDSLGAGVSDVVDGVSTLGDVVEAGNDELITVLTDLDADNDLQADEQTGLLEQIELNTGTTAQNITDLITVNTDALSAVNQTLANIENNQPNGVNTETAIDSTAVDASLQTFDEDLDTVANDLNAAVNQQSQNLATQTDALTEAVDSVRNYFMPVINTSGGCDLGTVNIFGNSVVLSLCPYMDLFILIGNRV